MQQARYGVVLARPSGSMFEGPRFPFILHSLLKDPQMHKIFSIEMVHIELTCNDESNYSNLDSLRYTKLQGMPADGFAEKAKKDEKDPKAAANAGAINSMQATDKNGKTNVKARRDQK